MTRVVIFCKLRQKRIMSISVCKYHALIVKCLVGSVRGNLKGIISLAFSPNSVGYCHGYLFTLREMVSWGMTELTSMIIQSHNIIHSF